MSDPRKPIFNAIRAARGDKGFTIDEVVEVDAVLTKLGVPHASDVREEEPAWITEARHFIGQREIPGPRHNSWIAKGWARLGAGWYNDDETPWCGFFVAHCVDAVGIEYPGRGLFARAKAWLDWGRPCGLIYGAVAVFGRQGGGHVGFIVGESDANLYILGGNQSNAVTITPIARSRVLGYRWPAGRAITIKRPPKMSGGTISRNEA